MTKFTMILALLMFVPFTSVTAQEPPSVKVGDRVRVTAPDLGIRKQAGRFAALRADTLVVAVADSTMTFPVASVTRLELSRGQKSYGGAGARIGFLSGAAIGAIIGFTEGDECRLICTRSANPLSAEARAVLGAISLGGIGALIGLVAGRLHKTDLWEEVPLDQLRVSVGPQRDGRFGLGLSVRF